MALHVLCLLAAFAAPQWLQAGWGWHLVLPIKDSINTCIYIYIHSWSVQHAKHESGIVASVHVSWCMHASKKFKEYTYVYMFIFLQGVHTSSTPRPHEPCKPSMSDSLRCPSPEPQHLNPKPFGGSHPAGACREKRKVQGQLALVVVGHRLVLMKMTTRRQWKTGWGIGQWMGLLMLGTTVT